MEVFLLLNGYEIDALVDDQEQIILQLASGRISRTELAQWLSQKLVRASLS